MKRVWISKTGAPEVLEVREEADPAVKAGEVGIDVHFCGINFADLMARLGLYPDAPKLPCVVGYEVSGVVREVGEGVTSVKKGDKVFAMPRFGGYTSYLVVSDKQVFHKPEDMSFEQAAALPVVYLTAYYMMMFTGNLRPKSRVLIHSAAGGVGLAAIELAKTRDCEIFGTASPGKHEFLRTQGVAHPINSLEPIGPQVRAALQGASLDLVLDPVGGPSWTEGYQLLGPAGRLVCFGLSAAASGKTRSLFNALKQIIQVKKYSPMALMDTNKTVSGCNMGHMFDHVELLIPQAHDLLELFKAGKISPRVDKVFPFSEAAAAHHFIHDRKAIGKVLLSPD